MASRKDMKKGKKKDEKPGLLRRIKNFFSDIRAELKRVTWPDSKRLKTNTGTVIAIILIATFTIFIFDTVISSVLSGTGFYTYGSDKATKIEESIEDTSSEPDSKKEDSETDAGAEKDAGAETEEKTEESTEPTE